MRAAWLLPSSHQCSAFATRRDHDGLFVVPPLCDLASVSPHNLVIVAGAKGIAQLDEAFA